MTTLSSIRRRMGLPDDSASNDIWNRRIESGSHSLQDVERALREKRDAWDSGQAYNTSGQNASAPSSFRPQPRPNYEQGSSGQNASMPTVSPEAPTFGQPSVREAVYQTGSTAGDSAFTSPEQVNQRLQDIRRNRGLSADPASDRIWADRIAAGTHTLGDARTAISNRAIELSRDTFGEQLPVVEQPEVPQSEAWGFDPQYNETINQIEEQRAGLRSEEEVARRRMAEDRQLAEREASRLRDDSLEANIESMADRGLVHSGINIEAQQHIGEDYLRYTDEIQRAAARGEEDLARWLTQQRNRLQTAQGTAETQRAENEALRRELDDLNGAINATPEPTVAGRYPIDTEITDEARQLATQGNYGGDAAALADPNTLAQRIEAIFNNRNVSLIGHGDETDWQRLNRIAQEVGSGYIDENGERQWRSLDDVRASVDRIARIQNI